MYTYHIVFTYINFESILDSNRCDFWYNCNSSQPTGEKLCMTTQIHIMWLLKDRHHLKCEVPVFVTSCVTCYVISNYMSFCCIVDSANQMYLRVIAQPCALGLQDVAERSQTRGVFDSNKS